MLACHLVSLGTVSSSIPLQRRFRRRLLEKSDNQSCREPLMANGNAVRILVVDDSERGDGRSAPCPKHGLLRLKCMRPSPWQSKPRQSAPSHFLQLRFKSNQNIAPAQRLYCSCMRFLFVLGSTTLWVALEFKSEWTEISWEHLQFAF